MRQKKYQLHLYKTYFNEIKRFYHFAIPDGSRVLELGCASGDLIASLNPSHGLGVDIDAKSIELARIKHQSNKSLQFRHANIEIVDWKQYEPFDYIIISDLFPLLSDVQSVLTNLQSACSSSTRIIMNFHNNLWTPLIQLATFLRIRSCTVVENWFSTEDVSNMLYLSGYQVITQGSRILLPIYIPLITPLFNRFIAKLPFLNHLCLTCTIMARPERSAHPVRDKAPGVSVLIPTKDEKGNVDGIFSRTPKMGAWTELVFVDGNSTDGTYEAVKEKIETHGSDWRRCTLLKQTGKGKGQAVRQGFDACKGDILMILDSDLTMPPEDLPKYFDALVSNKGEFINGSRLVYPMEDKAMRLLNMIANKLFAILFTWLLEQPVKDTLCGTKVLWRKDYLNIAENRHYFGDFDPFGDFDLLFGASKLNLKIVDMPVRYRERIYGDIKISRWTHGILLLRMCLIAFKKLKLS
jgi:hypothetical protein